MRTVTLEVRSLKDSLRAAAADARRGKAATTAYISFATPELLWQVLTAKRWEILKAMTGAGALSVREVARRVERDVKAVHADVQALLKAGILERAQRKAIFPYDTVHVDFRLGRAA